MIYLTGAASDEIEARLLELGVGFMWNPQHGYSPDRIARYRCWAADNGCFAAGDRFDLDRWLSRLGRFAHLAGTCLFAVAPDVVGDAAATWERSRDVLPVIRDMGFPAAFVGQDGQEGLPVHWDTFDAWFAGGSTAWKLSEPAYALAAEAKRRGKWTHMGRVNSLRRFRAAALSGYDSADGTCIAYNPVELTERVAMWLSVTQQPSLFRLEPSQ